MRFSPTTPGRVVKRRSIVPHSHAQQRARTLQRYTGARGTVAGRYLAARDNRHPLIPAADASQAALETRLLFAGGQFDYGRWDKNLSEEKNRRPRFPPWGFDHVLGARDELQVSVHPRFLPQFIDHVLPRIEAGGSEVYGIAGLRAQTRDRCVLLQRPGQPGRVLVRVSRKGWEQAARRALHGIDRRNVPWLTHPDSWHPAETAFHTLYGRLRDFGADGNAFLSNLLRRYNALASDRDTSYWHLWTSRRGSVELEWRAGPDHREVLDLLLDPRFGLDAELEDPELTCRCDDTDVTRYNECYSIAVVGGGINLNLRRQRPYGLDLQAATARIG